jgi:hypothetical protein
VGVGCCHYTKGHPFMQATLAAVSAHVPTDVTRGLGAQRVRRLASVWCDGGAQMPLHDAAAAGDLVTMSRLVAEGSDVNVPGPGGTRPLHWRRSSGRRVRYAYWWK